jgi:hypothetical protein
MYLTHSQYSNLYYRLDDRGSILGTGKDFPLLHLVQTGSGIHLASYPGGTGGSFLGVETAGA